MTRRARFRRILEDITSSSVASPTPLLLVLVLTILVHLVSSVDLGFSNLGARLIIAALSVIPALGIVVFVHSLKIPHVARPWIVLITYLGAGALRGFLLDFGLQAASLAVPDSTNYREAAGSILTTAVLCLVSYSWLAFQRARKSLNDLENRYRELWTVLKELELTSKDEVEKWSLDLVEEIRLQLDQLVDINATEAQNELTRLVGEVIRPLSRKYAKAVQTWEPDEVDLSLIGHVQAWRKIDLLPSIPNVLPPVLLISVASIASLAVLFSPRTAAEMIVLVGLTFYISVRLCFAVLVRVLKDKIVRWRELIITAVMTASAIAPAAMSVVVLRNYPDPRAYLVPILIVTPVFGWVVVIGNAARQRLHHLASELALANRHLEWSIARLNLLSWHQNGAKSRLLHGPIQNSIHVALLRLRTADENRPAVLQETKNRIGQALLANFSNISAENEVAALKDLVTTWGPLAHVAISIDDAALSSLKNDLPALAITVDIIQELCSNAIRHGQASEIDVDVQVVDNSVYLKILDNGTVFEQSSAGIGFRMIESCSMSWQRTSTDRRNHLEITLPLVRFTETDAGSALSSF